MRRRLVIYMMVVAGAFAALALISLLQGLRARADLRTAADELQELRDSFTIGMIRDDAHDTLARLDQAADRVRAARGRLRAPWLAPARVLPFAGRQMRAVISLCDGAEQLIVATSEAVADASPLLGLSTPADIVPTLDGVIRVVERFESAISGISMPEPGALVGPLRQATEDFDEVLVDARTRATDARDLLPVLRRLLGGDGSRSVLLAILNNAEMRGSGGMLLSLGVLTIDQGRFSLGPVVHTGDFTLDPEAAARIPMPAGYEEAFGWLLPTEDFRNTLVSAAFPQTGPLVAAMFEDRTGQRADTVLAVDVVTLETIVGVIGDIEVPELGATLTGHNTVDVLLSDTYRRFADDQEARQSALGYAATAVAGRLDAGGYPAADVAAALGDMVGGRHLMAWSPDPAEQDAFVRTGLAGGFPTDGLVIMSAVQNLSANKLDYYVEPSLDVSLALTSSDIAGELTVTITNPTPLDEGLPQYVVGPNEGSRLNPGEYQALVTVWLPPGTAVADHRGSGDLAYVGQDAGHTLAVATVLVPPGQEREVTVAFVGALVDGTEPPPVMVLPLGRVRPVPLRVTATAGREGLTRSVELSVGLDRSVRVDWP